MRFIHTADWQIGMKAAHVGKAAERVRNTRLETIRRIQHLARESNAEFVLVAGDTFEDHGVSRKLVVQVGDLLGGFDCPVYVIPGNHDPWTEGGVWDQARDLWSKRTQVLVDRSPIQLPGGWLFPCPLTQRWSEQDPTKWIPAESAGGIRIGVAHGSLQSLGWQAQQDHPIPMDAAQRSGLDYLALGHWHSMKEMPGNGGSVMAYSGTPEPTAFGETDSGYVLLVDIEAHGARPTIEKRKTGELEWWNLNEEIRAAGDLDRLIESLKQLRNPGATLIKLQLTGVLFAADAGLLEELPDLLSERFLYSQIDDSALVPAPEDDSWISNLPDGCIREAAERLKQNAHDEKNVVARRALLDLYRFANGGVA